MRNLLLPARKIILAASLLLVLGLCHAVNPVAWAHDEPSFGPTTIFLHGLTWPTTIVTAKVKAESSISSASVLEARHALSDWSAAIAHRHGALFTLEDVSGDSTISVPDITILLTKRDSGSVCYGGIGGVFAKQTDPDTGEDLRSACELNVLSKSSEWVLARTLQLLGFAFGMWPGEDVNPYDIMFRPERKAPRNTVISRCDMDAWDAVMHWLVSDPPGTSPHPPHRPDPDPYPDGEIGVICP